MAEHAPNAKITTIDRNPEMIGFAKENFAQFDTQAKITPKKRCGGNVLSTDRESYDFIYGFCTKSKYIVFLTEILTNGSWWCGCLG